jgi:hypothetical protein
MANPSKRPQPPPAATLPVVVAALVVPAALAWILLGPYVGMLVTVLAAVGLVVVAVNYNR